MLELTNEKLESLVEEYGADSEVISDIVNAANSFEFIPDDESRAEFVANVLINYASNNGSRRNYSNLLRGLGDVISDAAHDCYSHNISANDEVTIERVRTKYEKIK
jgi:hypothetical protein